MNTLRQIESMNKYYRTYIGRIVAKYARENSVEYFKVRNEIVYPDGFLEKYFSENPIPIKNNDCEPITLEMIKILPIKMLFTPQTNDDLTSDGVNVFLEDKCIGFWIN